MNKEKAGTILAIIAALFSGIAIPANKIFIVDMQPAVFTAVRSVIIGVIFLGLSLAFTKRKKVKMHIPWKYALLIAAIGGSAAFLLFFTGLKMTTAGHAAFLHKTLPLYAVILAFLFLKEKITLKFAAAMGVMIAGIVAIYSSSISPAGFWANPQFGDMLVISATVLWAVENIIAKKAMKSGADNLIISFARMFFGGLILFGAVILSGSLPMLALTAQQSINIAISIALLLAYVLFYYWSLKLINVSKAAVLLLIAPVVSLVIGIYALGEPAPPVQLAGSALILAGAFYMSRVKSEQRGI